MKLNNKKVLLCNCEGSMSFNAKEIAKNFGEDEPFVHSQLCRSQQPEFQKAMAQGDLLVACGREAPLFEELRAELGENAPDISYVDIREKAGWGKESKKASPKIAAMLAEATLTPDMVESVPLKSDGTVLIYGAGDIALEAAAMLQGRLSPVVVLTDVAGAMAPKTSDLPIFKGIAATMSGHMGEFKVQFASFAPMLPSSKGELAFTAPQSNLTEGFDLILDLSDGSGYFPAHQEIDGYVKVASTDKAGLYRKLFELSDMVGEFSKPRYAEIDENKCAHSRNRITGCMKCIDACSHGAILSAGNVAQIDPYICAGCGDCSAVCPTGAVGYTTPSLDHIHRRMQKLLSTYVQAGGKAPVLLVHDVKIGEEALNLLGQVGDGLPANVIPFALNSVSVMDHGLLLAAIAYGATGVCLLAPASDYDNADTVKNEIALAQKLLTSFNQKEKRFLVIDQATPDYISDCLSTTKFDKSVDPIEGLAIGFKRQRARKIFTHLNKSNESVIPLAAGAPYGQVVVDQSSCSMCMSCVGACPAQALRASQDAPILSFVEQDCVQCGICKSTCPEKSITLDARLNLSDQAISPVVLKEDQPAHCAECGKAFGTQSAVDTVVEKLSKLPQFANSEQLNNLRKCEDCRVIAIAKQNDPFTFGDRPKPRTTDDYLN